MWDAERAGALGARCRGWEPWPGPPGAAILLLLAPGLVPLGGCNEAPISALGDEGRIRYWVPRGDFEEESLEELRFAVGADHRVSALLTGAGRLAVRDPSEVAHRAQDGDHWVSGSGGRWERVGPGHVVKTINDFEILGVEPGTAVVETHEGARVIDRIGLNFEQPAALRLAVRARGPDRGAESLDIEPPYTVEAGTVLSFTVFPVDPDGERLFGQFTNPSIRTEPPLALAPYTALPITYEDSVVPAPRRPLEFTILTAGLVRIDVSDDVSGAEGSIEVEVLPRMEGR